MSVTAASDQAKHFLASSTELDRNSITHTFYVFFPYSYLRIAHARAQEQKQPKISYIRIDSKRVLRKELKND
jgi:hypothetical protein